MKVKAKEGLKLLYLSLKPSLFFKALHLSFAGNSDRLTWVRLQQPQEQRYPFLTVRAVFSWVQTKVWLQMLGTFNVLTDVNACDCTRGLYGHHEKVCTECWLWEKNPLPHRGIEPASAAWRSDTLPTELHLSYGFHGNLSIISHEGSDLSRSIVVCLSLQP